eukprot:gene941-10703_t
MAWTECPRNSAHGHCTVNEMNGKGSFVLCAAEHGDLNGIIHALENGDDIETRDANVLLDSSSQLENNRVEITFATSKTELYSWIDVFACNCWAFGLWDKCRWTICRDSPPVNNR